MKRINIKNIKIKPKYIIGFIGLFLCFSVFFTYALGLFDIAFIARPRGNDERETDNKKTSASPFPVETQGGSSDDGNDDDNGDIDFGQGEVIYDKGENLTFSGVSSLTEHGYALSNTVYSPESHVLGILNVNYTNTNQFTLSNRIVTEPYITYEYINAPPTLNWQDVEKPRPAVEAYMGYLLVDDGEGGVNILDSFGNHISRLDTANYEPAFTRDKNGNPLWRRRYYRNISTEDGERTETISDYSYYVLNASGYMVPADYNDAVDNRGLYADYPAWYGITDSPMRRSCTVKEVIELTLKNKLVSFFETQWKFSQYDEELSEDIYYGAYDFSDGYACVVDEEGRQYFIDQSARATFAVEKDYFNIYDRRMIESYRLPLTRGIESLGFFYVENGLVRVRKQVYDYYQLDDWDILKIETDDDIMIYADGTEFKVPLGYDIISYSDGMILLEKDGKYGYMDYTGKWKLQPIYEDAGAFMEGLAYLKLDGKYGMIDKNGKTVVPFIYDSIQTTSSGVIVCHNENDGWVVYLKMTTG